MCVVRRLLALLLPAAMLAQAAAGAGGPVEESRRLMGTLFRVTVHADDREGASRAIERAFDEGARLQHVLSSRDAQSELSALNDAPEGEPFEAGETLASALAEAWRYAHATGGAFDPTLGPSIRLWRWSKSRGQLPRPDMLEAARQASGYGKLVIEGRLITKTLAGMSIDLGGIGKGMAVDRMAAVLEQDGFRCYCISSTSDVRTGDPPPGKKSWRIACGVDEAGKPAVVLDMSHGAVSASGGSRQFTVIDGVRYSHVIDPSTGLGMTGDITCIVIHAQSSTEADALATACQVLPPDEAAALMARFPGCRIVEGPGASRQTGGAAGPDTKVCF